MDRLSTATPLVQGFSVTVLETYPSFVYKLSDSVSWEESALIEPQAVAYMRWGRSELQTRYSVLLLVCYVPASQKINLVPLESLS